MILLEFAAQGVRGVAPAGGRATLRPGYNVVSADGAALRRLLEALLYPDPRDGDALPRAPGGPPGAGLRAGLTFVGDDGVTYRLVRDFQAGAQLHRFEQAKRSFALVSQDLADIAQLMRAPGGAPAPARLGALLSIAASDLPSKRAGAASGAGLTPRAQLSPDQARKRIGALEAELERARVAEKLQYRLDGLQQRTFKLDEALKQGGQLREGLEKAEADRRELQGAAEVAGALGDPDARIAAYEKASARRDEALARVEAERAALAQADTGGAPPPLWRLTPFWAGVGCGAVALAVGAAGALLGSDLRYAALLDVPALGFAAFVALRWVSSLEDWERTGRRSRVIEDWERKMLEQFERDAAPVRAAMQALNVTKIAELKEQLARVGDAEAVVAEWRRRIEEWESNPGARDAVAEKSRLDEELREVETQLTAEAGGFVRDARSIEQEIRRLEQEAAQPAPAPVAPSAPVAAPPGDSIKALLERAAAELGQTPAGTGRAVAAKASQALNGLSFQRLPALSVDDRGNVQVTVSGRPSPVLGLPPQDRDLVFLALKLGFLEQALAAKKGLAVIEDVFAGLSDGARRFAARLLKQLARGAQIVHATTDPACREAADHAA
ncbi:MAG TPA: hypothetical protein VLU43_06330 [Anaeromyxobacteraceae bacterium]|nr:hypothetical protein [Anaeromyxobacteraceae bacterium]